MDHNNTDTWGGPQRGWYSTFAPTAYTSTTHPAASSPSRNGAHISDNGNARDQSTSSQNPRYIPSPQQGSDQSQTPVSRQPTPSFVTNGGPVPPSAESQPPIHSRYHGSTTSNPNRSGVAVRRPPTVPNGNPGFPRHQHQHQYQHQNVPPIRSEWRNWDSLTLRIRPLPSQTTTADLYNHFQRYGTIVWIDLSEDAHGARTGSALVRFSPPPAQICWVDSIKINVQGKVVRTDASLLPERKEQPISSPMGVKYPQKMSIIPSGLQFGVLVQEKQMMPLRTIENNIKGEFLLTLDLKFKQLETRFACNIKDPRREDPSIKHSSTVGEMEAISEYKTWIPLATLKRLVFIENDDETWSLLIPLPSPPVSYKKRDFRSPNPSKWGESEAWSRAADIAYDTTWLRKEAIAIPRSNQFIDIGRWTTWKLSFNKSKLADWKTMETALQDYNIETRHTTASDFVTVPTQVSNFWQILEPLGAPDAANANLALLLATEDLHLPYEVRYQLEVCISQGFLNEVNITGEFLRKLVDLSKGRTARRDRAKDLLTYVAEPLTRGRRDNFEKLYEDRIYDPMSLFEDRKALNHYPEFGLPEHCVWIRKVVVTPSTIILTTPTPEPSNRVLRKYASYADRFVRVQFTDELAKGRIFPSPGKDQSNALFNRVFRTLCNGLQIGGRHFQYLASGNSQFRENGAYFFSETDGLTCDNIRSWMGDVNHIRVVAKYAARLGQCFSTTRTPKGIPIGQTIKEIPDIERNDWCFTDGVGKIAPELARYITQHLNITKKDTPSAFQFRLGGSKGILVTWPDVTFNEVHLRPSQKKFMSMAKNVEIIKASRFSTATLNRQTITILSSLGVPDEVFVDLLKKQLVDYERAMEDPETAVRLLSRFVDENGITTTIAQMIVDGFMQVKELFFMALLQLWRAWSMRLLREKARIIVEKGAFVLGCIDETFTLRGHTEPTGASEAEEKKLPQIFLQVPKLGANPENADCYTVITGTCVVGRNPSLHPGDIRVVEAVDIPSLRHLRDVVVFPATGDRDIPSMCSGGDLDGDDFFVIWDPQLIPAEWNHPPMIHEPVKPTELQRPVRIADMIQFFVTYMKNDSLSTIAHAHLAQSDALDNGPKHPSCVKLAHLHSNAVDYPKSGQPAHAGDSLLPKKWPHFMERAENKSYRSSKVLGQLYDIVTQVNFTPKYDGNFDERILRRYDVSKEMLKSARIIKRQHDRALQQIMKQLEIGTEFEVWSTFTLTKPRIGNDYKMQEVLGPLVTNHRERFRTACARVVGSRESSVLCPMIAAIYRVTWEEVQSALQEVDQTHVIGGQTISRRKDTPETMPLISFPWIFEQELGRIANAKGKLALDAMPTISHTRGDEGNDDDDEYERLVGAGLIGGNMDEENMVSPVWDAPAAGKTAEGKVDEDTIDIIEEMVELEECETGLDELARLAN